MIRTIRIPVIALFVATAVFGTAVAGEVTCFGPTGPNGRFTTADHIVFATNGSPVEPGGGDVVANGSGGAQVSLHYAGAEGSSGLHLGIASTAPDLAPYARFFEPVPPSDRLAVITMFSEPRPTTFRDAADLVVRLPLQPDARTVKAMLLASDVPQPAELPVRATSDGSLSIPLPLMLPACAKVLLQR